MDARAAETGLRSFLERAMPLLAGGSSDLPDAADAGACGVTLQPLSGDGSRRVFFRVGLRGMTAVAIANGLPPQRQHPDENESFFAVREYLARCGVRVPLIYAADLAQGLFLLEDLGDRRLADLAGADAPDPSSRRQLYVEAIDLLVMMQTPRDPAFDPAITGNPAYSETFILNEEAGYFHAELVQGLAGLNLPFAAITAECHRLAHTALAGSAVFMHRDFQSRNIMLAGPSLVVIDFQGARHGPPEYDLASLIWDPYSALPGELRSDLIAYYLRRASAAGIAGVPSTSAQSTSEIDREAGRYRAWNQRFLANAANRLMQALGAFAKLGWRQGRPGFREHIPTALGSLHTVLSDLGDCPQLLALIEDLRSRDLHHFPR
jgi:aminoglycoside/choline kinase family phosphotransferase